MMGRSYQRTLRAAADSGVSPVVGTILILAISIVAISAIIAWGLPAIEELKANAESRAVLDQFRDLDDGLQSLVAGSAGKTTFKWQPTLNEGSLAIDQTQGGRWVVATDLRNGYNFTYFGLNDTDRYFALHNNGYTLTSALKVRAWTFIGSTFTELTVNTTSGGAATALTLANGENVTLQLYNSTGSAITLNALNIRIYLYNNSLVTASDDGAVARLWLTDVGSTHYETESGVEKRHVFSTNGAVIYGPYSSLVVANEPPIPPVRTYTNSTGGTSKSAFIRLIQINGSASFGGARQAELLMNLYSTTSLVDESNVSSVRIYVLRDATFRETWYDYLSDTANNYTMTRLDLAATAPVNGITMNHENLYYQFSGEMRFRVVYSVVTALRG